MRPAGGWRRLWGEVPWLLRRARRSRHAPGLQHQTAPGPPPRWHHWRHVTKLDPDRPLPDTALQTILASGTDAVIIGGTQGITEEKVVRLLDRVAGHAAAEWPIPVALEVSVPEAAVPGVETYFIPLVLNSQDGRWLAAPQAQALSRLLPWFGRVMPWERMWPSAYLVLNPKAAVARRTGAVPLTTEEAAGFAALAGRIWRLPLVYVEYSGRMGNRELVEDVRRAAGPHCRIWYGGGIQTPDQAAAMASAAHTVVVGNLAHENPDRLAATVEAVQAVRPPG